MSSDDETRHEPQIKCPWCGWVDTESWDHNWRHETIETQCSQCDKPIHVTQNVSVTYTTKKGN